MADDQTFYDAVEGYCGRLSYFPGEIVEVHTSTTADTIDVRVERCGRQRELVFTASSVVGFYTPVPDDADEEGCGWPVSVEFEVRDDWRSGFYLVTLTAHGVEPERSVAHAGFVVRGARSSDVRPSTLYVLPTNTWNAYNTWGGKSLYTGGSKVSFARPFARGMLDRPSVDRDDRKARPTRFREVPDADGLIFQQYRTENAYPSAIGSTGWFTHGRRFVEWAETQGFDFDYAVSSDLEDDPTALDGYDNVLLVGHDEYWSAPQRAALETHVESGGDLASFSGNTIFWRVRIEAATYGTSMVCFKYRGHLDDPALDEDHPGEPTGMWGDPSIGQPEWTLLGGGSAFGLYHRFGQATAQGVGGFIVYREDHWLFEGTGLRYGDVLGRDDGAVGYETLGCPITLDEWQLPVPNTFALDAGVPEQTDIVACVPSSNLGVGEYPKSIAALSDQGDLEFIAERIFGNAPDARSKARFGNAVMLTCRPYGDSGGEVITIGSTDWVFALEGDAAVQTVTKNVLNRMQLGEVANDR
ncbi:MAG: hypothetical protein ACI81L_002179 [Verrucomicrobiales bacterium]|jgi:hypothetical protein